MEIQRYRKMLPWLFILDAIMLLSAAFNIFDYSVINGFIVPAITIFVVVVRIKLLPVVDLLTSQTSATSVAPFLVIFEHVVHFFGLALVGFGAALYGGPTTKSFAAFLLPVAGLLILLPFVNLLIDFMGKRRH